MSIIETCTNPNAPFYSTDIQVLTWLESNSFGQMSCPDLQALLILAFGVVLISTFCFATIVYTTLKIVIGE